MNEEVEVEEQASNPLSPTGTNSYKWSGAESRRELCIFCLATMQVPLIYGQCKAVCLRPVGWVVYRGRNSECPVGTERHYGSDYRTDSLYCCSAHEDFSRVAGREKRTALPETVRGRREAGAGHFSLRVRISVAKLNRARISSSYLPALL